MKHPVEDMVVEKLEEATCERCIYSSDFGVDFNCNHDCVNQDEVTSLQWCGQGEWLVASPSWQKPVRMSRGEIFDQIIEEVYSKTEDEPFEPIALDVEELPSCVTGIPGGIPTASEVMAKRKP